MPSAPRSSRFVAASARLIAPVAVLLAACDPLPPDAIRGPRKIVAGPRAACAIWDAAPPRCWGSTPFGAVHLETHPFAHPITPPDASDVALAPPSGVARSDGGCIVERGGVLACTPAWGDGRMLSSIRSAPSMRDLRAPVLVGARVCVVARTEAERDDAVWCLDRARAAALIQPEWERVDLGDVASLALAPSRLCALQRAGRVRCLDFSDRRVRDLDGIAGAVQIALGDDFGCVRDAGGGVRCFGDGPEARPIALSAPATEIVAAGRSACAIVNGAPMCWDHLGRGTIAPPQRVADLDDLGQIALGGDFTCATRKTDGTVRCWGRDADGELGDGSFLPPASCRREGIDGTSAERERHGGPTIVRTGEAGWHPQWRAPLAAVATIAFVAPIAASIALARASVRRMKSASHEAKLALYGHGIVTALLVPIAAARALTAAIAAWSGRYGAFRLEASWMGLVALAGLGPIIALAVAAASFAGLRRAERDGLPNAAKLASAWLVGLAGPLLGAAMVLTRRVSDQAQEELIYLVRDAKLDLGPFFGVRGLISLASRSRMPSSRSSGPGPSGAEPPPPHAGRPPDHRQLTL